MGRMYKGLKFCTKVPAVASRKSTCPVELWTELAGFFHIMHFSWKDNWQTDYLEFSICQMFSWKWMRACLQGKQLTVFVASGKLQTLKQNLELRKSSCCGELENIPVLEDVLMRLAVGVGGRLPICISRSQTSVFPGALALLPLAFLLSPHCLEHTFWQGLFTLSHRRSVPLRVFTCSVLRLAYLLGQALWEKAPVLSGGSGELVFECHLL